MKLETIIGLSQLLKSTAEIRDRIAVEYKSVESTESSLCLVNPLDMRCSDLDIPVRLLNQLRNKNIEVVGDLIKKSELDLLCFRNIGKATTKELRRVRLKMGLTLWDGVGARP